MSDQPTSPRELLSLKDVLALREHWYDGGRLSEWQIGRLLDIVCGDDALQSEKETSAATHWEGCGKEGGPRHYECLLRDYEELERKLRSAQSATGATD